MVRKENVKYGVQLDMYVLGIDIGTGGTRALIIDQTGRLVSSATEEQRLVLPGDDIDHKHGAFMDTAAIMTNLDLVISSDTSVPHLAAALGVPTWIALPFVANWQWLRDRGDSPWYPTARLFRQKTAADWNAVFSEIHAELAKLLQCAAAVR